MTFKSLLARWGPVIGTLLTVLMVDAATDYGLPLTLAVSFVFIVMAAYKGGLIPGIIAAAIVAVYTFYHDPEVLRATIISLLAHILAIQAGLQQKALQRYGTAESALEKMQSIDNRLKELLDKWDDLSHADRHDIIRVTQHEFTNALMLTQGWHDLAQEQKEARGRQR